MLLQLNLPGILQTFRRESVLSTKTSLNKPEQLPDFVQLKLIAEDFELLRFVRKIFKSCIGKIGWRTTLKCL
jgi:hypothetical protein